MRPDRDTQTSRSVLAQVSRPSRLTTLPQGASLGRIGLAVAAGLLVANCASQQKMASRGGGIDPKYGVSASPKVVADGEPVPKGGGQYMVGKPYVVGGRLYTPRENAGYSAVGLASWYGPSFHGRLTANGEVFDRDSVTAAHPTMPLPSYVRVTNLANGYSIIARVNDRGPYHGSRLIDVSQRVAEALSFRNIGTARVKVDYVGRASLSGSDDNRLMATLRTDGGAASLRGGDVQVASAAPVAAPQPEPQRVIAPAPVVAQDEADEAPATPAPSARAAAADAAPAGKPAPGVPLPPDRPFDFGRAAKPTMGSVPAKVPLPPARTAMRGGKLVTAGLFFAPEDAATAVFGSSDPMKGLTTQAFLPLRRSGDL